MFCDICDNVKDFYILAHIFLCIVLICKLVNTVRFVMLACVEMYKQGALQLTAQRTPALSVSPTENYSMATEVFVI